MSTNTPSIHINNINTLRMVGKATGNQLKLYVPQSAIQRLFDLPIKLANPNLSIQLKYLYDFGLLDRKADDKRRFCYALTQDGKDFLEKKERQSISQINCQPKLFKELDITVANCIDEYLRSDYLSSRQIPKSIATTRGKLNLFSQVIGHIRLSLLSIDDIHFAISRIIQITEKKINRPLSSKSIRALGSHFDCLVYYSVYRNYLTEEAAKKLLLKTRISGKSAVTGRIKKKSAIVKIRQKKQSLFEKVVAWFRG